MPNTDPMQNGQEGPAEQEARYQKYEKRRKQQETEHREMDFFIDDVVNKILNSEVPKTNAYEEYDYKYRPGGNKEEDEDDDDGMDDGDLD